MDELQTYLSSLSENDKEICRNFVTQMYDCYAITDEKFEKLMEIFDASSEVFFD